MSATVVLDVFSGLRQPTWALSDADYNRLLDLVKKLHPGTTEAGFEPAVWGYKGFVIKKPGRPTIRITAGIGAKWGYVYLGGHEAVLIDTSRVIENFLLENSAGVVEKLGLKFQELVKVRNEKPIKGFDQNGVVKGFGCEHGVSFPSNPTAWKNSSSNCYNYANNVMAPGALPAVPGNNNVVSFTSLKIIKAATENDKLTLITPAGKLPQVCPAGSKSHIMGIFLREPMGNGSFTDFHCLRMDSDGTWSHKDGSGPLRKKDDAQQPMTDLRQARFKIELTVVGFFISTKGVRHIN